MDRISRNNCKCCCCCCQCVDSGRAGHQTYQQKKSKDVILRKKPFPVSGRGKHHSANDYQQRHLKHTETISGLDTRRLKFMDHIARCPNIFEGGDNKLVDEYQKGFQPNCSEDETHQSDRGDQRTHWSLGHSSMSSQTLLEHLKPVRSKRTEWETRIAKMKYVNDISENKNGRSFLNPVTVYPVRTHRSRKLNENLPNLMTTEPHQHTEFARWQSNLRSDIDATRKQEHSEGYMSSPPRLKKELNLNTEYHRLGTWNRIPVPPPVRLPVQHNKSRIFKVKEEIAAITATADGSGSNPNRESYIESEDIRRVLFDENGKNSLTLPGKTLSDEEGSRLENLRPYVERWKSYRKQRVTSTAKSRNTTTSNSVKAPLPPNTGLAYFEYNFKGRSEAGRQEIFKRSKKKAQSLPPSSPRKIHYKNIDDMEPPSPLPPQETKETVKSWWDYFNIWPIAERTNTVTSPKKQLEENDDVGRDEYDYLPPSISAAPSNISFAMGIAGRGNAGLENVDFSLKSISQEYDEMVVKNFTPGNVMVKKSSLELNRHFQQMKSLSQSQLNLSSQKSVVDNIGGNEDQIRTSQSVSHVGRKCQACKKSIAVNERPGFSSNGVFWHKSCLKCATCGTMLGEASVFLHEAELYCLIHYAEAVNTPKCAHCGQYIFEPFYTRARGRTWHKNHFKCDKCQLPIVDKKFVARGNGEVVCYECHEKYYSHICEFCGQRIHPSEEFVFLKSTNTKGNYWHATAECLHCHFCGQNLVENSKSRLLFVKNGLTFCNAYCAAQFKKNAVISPSLVEPEEA